ncbi:HU family DNA-binding protein [Deinococcus budaensis]|nr:HU family DNA-binding protein [Deinococcus budaensis]
MRTMTKKAAKAPAAKKPAAPKAPGRATAESNKVGKTQLVEQVAEKSGLTRKQSDEAVSVVLDALVDAVRGGQSVGLNGVGTFSVKATAARTGVRPGTSEKIQIPAGKKVAFKVASTLKGTL